jgi:hypothetical protein
MKIQTIHSPGLHPHLEIHSVFPKMTAKNADIYLLNRFQEEMYKNVPRSYTDSGDHYGTMRDIYLMNPWKGTLDVKIHNPTASETNIPLHELSVSCDMRKHVARMVKQTKLTKSLNLYLSKYRSIVPSTVVDTVIRELLSKEGKKCGLEGFPEETYEVNIQSHDNTSNLSDYQSADTFDYIHISLDPESGQESRHILLVSLHGGCDVGYGYTPYIAIEPRFSIEEAGLYPLFLPDIDIGLNIDGHRYLAKCFPTGGVYLQEDDREVGVWENTILPTINSICCVYVAGMESI